MSNFKTRAIRNNTDGQGLPESPQKLGAEVFSFGEPEIVSRDEMINFFQCEVVGKWWTPPVSLDSLSKAFRTSVYHSSPIYTKVNILTSLFIPHPWMSASKFERVILDYFTLGNGYIEKIVNAFGKPIDLKPMPSKYMRRGLDLSKFFFIQRKENFDSNGLFTSESEAIEYPASRVLHMMKYDIDQEIYGIPEYLSALPSAWLNNEATMFRLRYYRNGSHAGVIMYLTDPTQSPADVDSIKESIRQSKGPGNFRNLFVYAPNGKKDGLQVIPLSEIAAKDEFFNIKNVTRDDLLAAHRVPRDLMSIASESKGAGGDLHKVAQIFVQNELMPVITRFKELNDVLGVEVFTFNDYVVTTDTTATAPA